MMRKLVYSDHLNRTAYGWNLGSFSNSMESYRQTTDCQTHKFCGLALSSDRWSL